MKWILVAAALVLLIGLAGPARAQVVEKHDVKALQDALKEVINTGADLFNKHNDYSGCYRVYQGGLLAVKPFLSLALQKEIEEGITAAEKLPRMSDRAFALRRVLDTIRGQAKDEATENPDKAATEKKAKSDVIGGAQELEATGKLEGLVTYKGQPVTEFYITLVSEDNRRYSTYIREDGKYAFKTKLPVGTYRILIEPAPDKESKKRLPERYRSESTSGLMIEIRAGKQPFDVHLQ